MFFSFVCIKPLPGLNENNIELNKFFHSFFFFFALFNKVYYNKGWLIYLEAYGTLQKIHKNG